MTGPRASLRERLRRPPPLLGTLLTVAAPEVAEALARCGVDWLFVDMEHSAALDPPAVLRVVQAVAGRCHVLVRVPANEPTWITRVLDTGADGIIVPGVRTVDDARRAVDAARYPPAGTRGVGLGRAQGYGLDLDGYLARADRDTAVVLQLEHIDAVPVLDQLLAVPGVDAMFIGPYDLSGSMGLLGRVTDPRVRAVVDRVRSGCAARGMPVGIFAGQVDAARAELAAGVALLAVGTDLTLLTTAARTTLRALAPAPAQHDVT